MSYFFFISLAMVKKACSTLIESFALVSKNGIPSSSANACSSIRYMAVKKVGSLYTKVNTEEQGVLEDCGEKGFQMAQTPLLLILSQYILVRKLSRHPTDVYYTTNSTFLSDIITSPFSRQW